MTDLSDTPKPRRFLTRQKLAVTAVVTCILIALMYPAIAHVVMSRRFFAHVEHVTSTIDSFEPRRPADIPEKQWMEAVAWTSNVISQDFFGPNEQELQGLELLAAELDKRAAGEVDMSTLRWIWDECEKACGGPRSYAIRFRKVRLLTSGTITDQRVPELWSVTRCTSLDLHGTDITDASVPHLAMLSQLEWLDIRDTGITDSGANELQRSLPDCDIEHR